MTSSALSVGLDILIIYMPLAKNVNSNVIIGMRLELWNITWENDNFHNWWIILASVNVFS